MKTIFDIGLHQGGASQVENADPGCLSPCIGLDLQSLSLPSNGEGKTNSGRGACTPGVSLVASQGAAGKGARRAWGCSMGGCLLAQRGKIARAGTNNGNGEGNSFSTGRDAGVGSLLRQMIPVDIENRYLIHGTNNIQILMLMKNHTPHLSYKFCSQPGPKIKE